MAFIIIWTGPNGANTVKTADASETLKKHQELQAAGYQKIVIKDDGGRTLKFQEIIALSAMGKPRA